MGNRYFWLKLKDDFFDSKRIKKLRRIAGGDTYTIIYLKMQLLALKKDGILRYDGLENTFAEELALDLDEEVDNVSITLNYLESCGLIETSDNINFFLPYVVENTGSETAAAQRMRDMRNRRICNNVTPQLQIGYVEKEIEKEKDIEIDKESEIVKRTPKKKQSNIDILNDVYEEGYLSNPLLESVKEWLMYKDELKNRYQGTGVKALLRTIKTNSEQYGTEKVIDTIRESMSNQYKGIVWDWLKKERMFKTKDELDREKHEKAMEEFWKRQEEKEQAEQSNQQDDLGWRGDGEEGV